MCTRSAHCIYVCTRSSYCVCTRSSSTVYMYVHKVPVLCVHRIPVLYVCVQGKVPIRYIYTDDTIFVWCGGGSLKTDTVKTTSEVSVHKSATVF